MPQRNRAEKLILGPQCVPCSTATFDKVTLRSRHVARSPVCGVLKRGERGCRLVVDAVALVLLRSYATENVMGWGERFPVLRQLNALTTPAHINDTHTFFTSTYGADGSGYEVGLLCLNWEPGQNPAPPWHAEVKDTWREADAQDWYSHCKDDLNVQNAGDGASGTVAEDLTSWIRDAILAKTQIQYIYLRRNGLNPPWKADVKTLQSGKVRITVSGPGF